MNNYDVIVIGAGPAGGACAAECARSGLQVAMVEDYGFGGTCPLRGCNPKKVLTGAAEIVALAQGLTGKGLDRASTIIWEDLAKFRDEFVKGKKDKIERAYQDLGIDTYSGRARFVDNYRIRVSSEILQGSYFVLATGIKPALLSFPGHELLSTSDDFLIMNTLPGQICFIGGGFISFELASVAALAGARVSIVHRGPRVLKQFDFDLTSGLVKAMEDAGVKIHLNADLESVHRKDGQYAVNFRKNGQQSSIKADMVVHGAGRTPDVEGLNLELTGVELSSRGITVDRHMQSTSNKRFFAVGDVADTPYALTPTGDLEGKVAAANILKSGSTACDYLGVPRVVFTSPPLCAVGLLEEQALEKKITLEKVHLDMSDWFSWTHLGQRHGACKILLDKDRKVIVGAHVLGMGAEELANMFALAIRLELPVEKIKQVLLAYPTKGYYFKKMLG
ncbi:dihydrolipoyl dehydrogenase family protein [Desulfonatronovibrio hydrogenovorans]|uniref:dihydrolipoyl dehydrogenase family protein n=1 Tax=Desulfonatronovibrio hydrogenovorans TaxID=53245 RepID=UPI00048B623D|nr:NAD(P)/FAD-dependent oxidoreductase [Desulfonatronovibrio hydrogenovorans]